MWGWVKRLFCNQCVERGTGPICIDCHTDIDNMILPPGVPLPSVVLVNVIATKLIAHPDKWTVENKVDPRARREKPPSYAKLTWKSEVWSDEILNISRERYYYFDRIPNREIIEEWVCKINEGFVSFTEQEKKLLYEAIEKSRALQAERARAAAEAVRQQKACDMLELLTGPKPIETEPLFETGPHGIKGVDCDCDECLR